jgi:hypothetical protein
LLIVGTLLLILIDIIQIPSLHRLSTLILRLLSTHNRSRSWWLILFLHIGVKLLSFIEDLHQLGIHLVTVQLLQDVLLVIELILWLFGLLGSLLFLDQGVSVLWSRSWFLDVLTMALSSTFCYLLRWLLPTIVFIFSCWLIFTKLIFIIDYMHRQTLIW